MSHMRRAWHVLVMLVATIMYIFLYMRSPVRRFTLQNVRQPVWLNFLDHWPIFFLGSLIAYFYVRLAEDRGLTLDKYPRIAACIGWFSVVAQYIAWRFPVLYYFYPSIPTSVSFWDNCTFTALHLALMLFGAPNVFTKWMSKCKLLRNCGKWSFGTYMLHAHVIVIIIVKCEANGIKIPSDDLFVIIILTAFTVGYVFYELVEKHMIRLAHYINNRMLAPSTPYVILPLTLVT